jgi:hypothetical protein
VHREYGTYFTQFFGLLVTIFAFVVALLTVMWMVVGLVRVPKTLIIACYCFSVAVIAGTYVCCGHIVLAFLAIFLCNMVITRIAHGKSEST